MPEGDTVYRAALVLDKALSGRRLLSTDFRVPQHATVDLSGGEVVSTRARGKHLLTRIVHDEVGWTLHTHLKMDGIWRVHAPGEKWHRPAHQARVLLEVEGHTAVGYALGIVELLPTADEESVVGHLGPDLLGPDWDEVEATARLGSDPDRTIHEALLDQRNLAGVGNVFAAELCFVSGLHPRAPVASAPDLRRIVLRARQMLELNKSRSTRTTTGNLRQPLWVYGRDRRACRRCGTAIETAPLGPVGRERVTYWCPRCQPAP